MLYRTPLSSADPKRSGPQHRILWAVALHDGLPRPQTYIMQRRVAILSESRRHQAAPAVAWRGRGEDANLRSKLWVATDALPTESTKSIQRACREPASATVV